MNIHPIIWAAIIGAIGGIIAVAIKKKVVAIISGIVIGIIIGLVISLFVSIIIPKRSPIAVDIPPGDISPKQEQVSDTVTEDKQVGGDIAENPQGQFSVTITNPQNGSEVGKEITVTGTASIPDGNHLWVLARRVDFEPLWWPQREAKIDPKTHKWSAVACFGGSQDINWDFHIGVITVNADGHRELMDYWTTAMKTGDWRPIQIPETTSPPQIIKVKKVSH